VLGGRALRLKSKYGAEDRKLADELSRMIRELREIAEHQTLKTEVAARAELGGA